MFSELIYKIVSGAIEKHNEKLLGNSLKGTGALRGPSDPSQSTTDYQGETPRDSFLASEFQSRILDLENKFMTLCSHLGIYITRTQPGPLFEVKDLKGLTEGILGATDLKRKVNKPK